MIMRKLSILCATVGFSVLAACSADHPSSAAPSSAAVASSSPIVGAINRAMDKAGTELATGNITVSHNDPDLPKAEITPAGDFIVGGKTIAVTPGQRAALLEYRKQVVSIAKQGIAIGKQGAAVGMQAAKAAIAAAFSGKSDQEIEQSVKAQAMGIREAAAKICERLPPMKTEQQKLAAVLPAFKPYATMTQKDIDDCRHDALHDDESDADQVRATVRDRIRQGIRARVRTAAQTTGTASNGASDPGTIAANGSSAQN